MNESQVKEVGNKEANRFGGDNKYESAISKLEDTELLSDATNGGLQQGPNRFFEKMKLAMTNSDHKVKGGAIQHIMNDMMSREGHMLYICDYGLH